MAQSASKSQDDLQADLAQLREDLSALREDVGNLTTHMKQAANGAAYDAKRKLAEGGARARQSAADAAAAARATADRNLAAVEGQIQAHPMAAIAIAFGVGLVAAQFMRRDR